MLQQGVGYTFSNSSGGSSLTIDNGAARYKETLPFFVFEDADANGNTIFRINAGTFNNVFPTVGGAQVGEANAYLGAPGSTSLVIMTIGASGGISPAFPSGTPFISLMNGTTIPENGLAVARVALAKITVSTQSGVNTYTVSNLVSGSLWGERFECGKELQYWFSRI